MADAIGPEFVHQRTNEKEELKGLNNRFARYLKRVQELYSLSNLTIIYGFMYQKLPVFYPLKDIIFEYIKGS